MGRERQIGKTRPKILSHPPIINPGSVPDVWWPDRNGDMMPLLFSKWFRSREEVGALEELSNSSCSYTGMEWGGMTFAFVLNTRGLEAHALKVPAGLAHTQ